jgi:hypothetical protein
LIYSTFHLPSCQKKAMARKPRVEFDGAFYHVIVRGNQRQRTFHDGDICTRSQGFYGNGAGSLAQEIACYGGFNGAYNANGDQTQAGTCNATLITIGTGTCTYEWHLLPFPLNDARSQAI